MFHCNHYIVLSGSAQIKRLTPSPLTPSELSEHRHVQVLQISLHWRLHPPPRPYPQRLLLRPQYGNHNYNVRLPHRAHGPSLIKRISMQAARLIMLAAGSGIAPMYQILMKLRDHRSDDMTRLDLVYSNSTEEDVWLREELEILAKELDVLRVYHVITRLSIVAFIGLLDGTVTCTYHIVTRSGSNDLKLTILPFFTSTSSLHQSPLSLPQPPQPLSQSTLVSPTSYTHLIPSVGRLDTVLLAKLLPSASDLADSLYRILICGPASFNHNMTNYMREMGYREEAVFVFK
ncbi:hypothetical protein BC936DRAFT_138871 [Jimgerdemannia flammicorona]|uniref:Oxidoreductase FAD/NAD(P)-binding domain-containing protein n=1 Tax=Jimgerdemannia flammicorona TaxID=994334 RepID=A0A433DI02_9FUNG|nr:hypothetical protein BC936DRAFT_138871 [Jimgerdemannia flammicorona]